MTDIWDRRIDTVIAIEGGYGNDPTDRGGPTNWGIVEAEARALGYTGDMRVMPRSEAVRIYRARYVTRPGLDKLDEIDGALAAKLFDGGVNCGTATAARWLQRCLNVLNEQGRLWPDLAVDGYAGAATRSALQRLIAIRGDEGRRVLLAMVTALQGAGYVAIAEGDATQERFEWGWQSQRAFPPPPIASKVST